METVRNIAFVVASTLIFAIVGINLLGGLALWDLPKQSFLEGRDYQQMPHADFGSFASSIFQNQFEIFVSDTVPKRDDVLLAHARLERAMIETANAVFGYKAIPTYLGSEYFYCADWNTIAQAPVERRAIPPSLLNEKATILSSLIDANEDLSWYIAVPDRVNISDASPIAELFSNAATYSYFREYYLDVLSQACTVIDISHQDTKEFYKDYFKTDHHWQIFGAIKAYDAIMDAIGKTPISFGEPIAAYKGRFFGSHSRNGKADFIWDETLFDAQYDHGPISVSVNGEEKDLSYVDSFWEGSYKKRHRFGNVYSDYYHSDVALIEYKNDEAPAGALLIIGDSYTNSMERFFAESWRRVYAIDPRFYSEDIQSFIDEHDIDDVLILANPSTLVSDTFSDRLRVAS